MLGAIAPKDIEITDFMMMLLGAFAPKRRRKTPFPGFFTPTGWSCSEMKCQNTSFLPKTPSFYPYFWVVMLRNTGLRFGWSCSELCSSRCFLHLYFLW